MHKLSTYQQVFLNSITDTKSHICLAATAGSGKTFSILESLKLIPKFKRSIFLSFSSGIVKELKDKVPVGIKASTLHSLGYGEIFRKHPHIKLDEDKYFRKALTNFYSDEQKTKQIYRDCYRIQDISNFMRMTLTKTTLEESISICNHFNIDFTIELLEKTIKLIESDKDYSIVDYTDMVYLPVINNLITQKYDFVFLDEAQDLNECQYQFVLKLLSQNGRLIAVGDPKQTIYGFAGNSSEIFKRIQSRENTINLTLPISYRCPKSVVQKAKEVCEMIEPFPDAIEGRVEYGVVSEVQEGDLVISRTTRPLISLFFQLLNNGVKSTIVGKDIEKGLVVIAERCKSLTIESTKEKFNKELEIVNSELKELGVKIKNIPYHQRYVTLLEKLRVLEFLLTKCGPPDSLPKFIHELFREDKKSTKLMTLHRSKGLENNRVFMIMKYNGERLLPSKYAIQDWELEQEMNLEFVGYTRSKSELIFLNLEDE